MGRLAHAAVAVGVFAACRSEPAPVAPDAMAMRVVTLAPASRRALAEAGAGVTISASFDGVEADDVVRVTALLDAFGAWRKGSGPAAITVARGPRSETLALPVQEGRLDVGEVEAGLVTRLLRLARGRRTVGVTVGHGEDGWDGLADAELGLGADYRVLRVAWPELPARLDALDVLVVDGPRGPLPAAAVAAVRGFGRPVLFLVDDGVDPAILPDGVRGVPGTLRDKVNGTPFERDGGLDLSAAPLAQVLAGGPGEPLARLAYVSMPLAVALLAPDSAQPLLRTSPQTEGGARVVGYAMEVPGGRRLAVVGSAALVGAARLSLHRRLGTAVTAGGFRAVSRLVDWLVADVVLQ